MDVSALPEALSNLTNEEAEDKRLVLLHKTVQNVPQFFTCSVA